MEAQPAVAAGGYRRILWAVLAINAAMFVIEGSAGLGAGSVSLQADSLDFMGDAVNYALALFVLGRTIRWRAGAALAKAAAMVVFGLWVRATTNASTARTTAMTYDVSVQLVTSVIKQAIRNADGAVALEALKEARAVAEQVGAGAAPANGSRAVDISA